MQSADNGKLPLYPNQDIGFKVFKLAESTMRQWVDLPPDTPPPEYIRQLELFIDPLRPGWEVENVIYEVALREGFGLNCLIEKVDLQLDNTIYRVTDPDRDQRFFICLDNAIAPDPTYHLGLDRTDLFICRDVALTDTLAANIALNCRLKTI
jgi:adenine-specific DNA-methyltransferase